MNGLLIIFLSLAFIAFCLFCIKDKHKQWKNLEVGLLDFICTIIVAATCILVQIMVLFAVFSNLPLYFTDADSASSPPQKSKKVTNNL